MTFWSYYVIALTAISLIGATWLLWVTSKKRHANDTQSSTETTGHIWDGDLSEYNKPLPRWWINLFYLTIVFAIGYLIWYPSADKVGGKGQWSSKGQHDADKAKADAKLQELYARFDGKGIDVIAQDAAALTTGKQIYANNCAVCHGSDAGGAKGFPNLRDAIWKFDGSPEGILTTIKGGVNVEGGRAAVMPAMAAVLGSEQAVTESAVYVQSLSGMKVDETLAAAGSKSFTTVCAACHGPDGKGNPALGAPNLTDNDWMYGNTLEDIKYGINNGRAGQMPAHLPLIGETQARLAAAYIYSLSQAK
ncbi:MAG: cytochrome-c oxidase, cbb3-type subunit III, partial [Arenimonas sp.]